MKLTTNNMPSGQKFDASSFAESMRKIGLDLIAPQLVPVGFIVSQAVYDRMKERMSPAPGEPSFNGTPMVVDPKQPETAVDVAYTREAWLERLAKIEN